MLEGGLRSTHFYLVAGAVDGVMVAGIVVAPVVTLAVVFFLGADTVFFALQLAWTLTGRVAGSIVSVPMTSVLYFPAPSTRASPQVFAATS
jgi:hypothetical protein